MSQKSKEVDQYLSKLEDERQESLGEVRSLILSTVPGIHETMKYCMPTYELDEVVCAMASQKQYMSLYLDVGLVEKHRPEFGKLNIGKSCVRFKRISDLNLDTVKVVLQETVKKQGSQKPEEKS